MVSRLQLARVAAVVVGVVMVGVVGFQFAQSGYTIHVEHVGSANQVPAGEPVLEYENLSAGTQEVIQRAFRSPGDTTTVSAGNRPPEFEYADRQIDHYMVFNGQYYRVTTGDRGVLAAVNGPLAYAALVVGLAAIVVGGLGLYREQTESDRPTAGD